MEISEKLESLVRVLDDNKISYNQGIKNSLNTSYANDSVNLLNERIIEYLYKLSYKCVANGLTKKELESIAELSTIDTKLQKVKKEKDIQKFETKVEEIIMNNPVEIKKEGMILESYKWIEVVNNCAIIMLNRAKKESEINYYKAVLERCENAFKLLDNCKDSNSKRALEFESVVCQELNKYAVLLSQRNTTLHSLNDTFDKVDDALMKWGKLTQAVSKRDIQKDYWRYQQDNRAQLIVDTENYREDLVVLREKLDSYAEATQDVKKQYDKKLESIKADQERINEIEAQIEKNKALLISGKMSKQEALTSGQALIGDKERFKYNMNATKTAADKLLSTIQLRNTKYDKLNISFTDLFLEKDNDLMLAIYMKYVNLKKCFAFIDGVATEEELNDFILDITGLQAQAKQNYEELKRSNEVMGDVIDRFTVDVETPVQTIKSESEIDAELINIYGNLGTQEEEQTEETVENQGEVEDVSTLIR